MNLINIFNFYIYIKNKIKINTRSNRFVLIEVFEQTPSLISYLFFFISLNKKNNLKPILFKPTNANIFRNRIKEFIPLSIINLYKLFFRSKKIIYPNTNNIKLDKKSVKILDSIKTKKDLINLKINNIWVGDLFYDNYLRSNNLITIDITSQIFKKEISKYIVLFLFWEKYFNLKKVSALIISHSVYLIGLPARIAINKNIKVYLVRSSDVVALSKKYIHAYDGYKDYPKIFSKINKKDQVQGLKIAKEELYKRLLGKSDKLTKTNQPNKISPFSSELKIEKNKNKNKNRKIKILVATHDFNDAIHIYGKNLFTDFYEWLEYLGNFSINQDYEWLIKFHPANFDGNYDKAKNIIQKYKKFKIIDKFSTHNYLIKQGIDCVLTVYGSIAHEYPLMNIPVINAGNNPHYGYDFCLHPRTVKEYEYYLKNIKNIKIKRNFPKKIFEFYFMNFLTDYSPLKSLSFFYGLRKQHQIFSYFFNKKINLNEEKIIDVYTKFIKSKKRKLDTLK